MPESPEITFKKAEAFLRLGLYVESIKACEKAERESPNKKYPMASCLRGVVLANMKQHEKAIVAFRKAELDSFQEKYPMASFNLGNTLCTLGRYEEAIVAYKKAEQDSPNKKYPKASCNLGSLFHGLGRYEEALIALEKAEQDSSIKDLKTLCNLAMVLCDLGRYEEAIVFCEKAISDSPNKKYPKAFGIKGLALSGLGRYEEAIVASKKAISDSPNKKNPTASFNQGGALTKLGRNEEAVVAYEKAISDSYGQVFPLAHYNISVLLGGGSNYEKAKKHAFLAINQDNRDFKIVRNIFDRFSDSNSVPFYSNRCKYLNILLQKASLKNYVHPKVNCFLFNSDDSTSSEKHTLLFLTLLKNEQTQFPTRIAYHERLKLAYIIHSLRGEYWEVYDLIDDILETRFPLDNMDYYFLQLSSYMIGESRNELKYFGNVKLPNSQNQAVFSELFNRNNEKLAFAFENNLRYDQYLYKCDLEFWFNYSKPNDHHKWIQDALTIDPNSIKNYVPPLTHYELLGMATRLITKLNSQYLHEYSESTPFVNYVRDIDDCSSENLSSYQHAISNIRTAIKSGIPFHVLLLVLFQKFDSSSIENDRKNLCVLQASVMVSHHLDFHKSPIYDKIETRIIAGCTANLFSQEALKTLIITGLAGSWGLSVGVNLIVSKIFKSINENREERVNDVFENLLSLIQTRN